MDPSRDAKKKKGGRMRTVTFSSKDATTDAKYLQGVKKLEEAFGTRGGYVIGEGALNKNDALYMMEEDEKKRLALQRRKEEETARFKQMVARDRTLKGAGQSGEEGSDDAGHEKNCQEGKVDENAALAVVGAKHMVGKKRRKTAKELLRVKKANREELEDASKTQQATEGSPGVDEAEKGNSGGLTSLFGAYDDSD